MQTGGQMTTTPLPFEILLVEDDSGDVELTRTALESSKIYANVNVVSDGVKALQFLRQEGIYQNSPRPDLVLLDLNMPLKDGRQVLKEVKNDPALKLIPVVVLTTSADEIDVIKSYNLGCNCYATKPVDFKQFMKIVKEIEEFWFTVVKLPTR
jgi:chemotaxis family two-component system response regulator Rcp1